MSVENGGGEVIKDRTRARGISERKKNGEKGKKRMEDKAAKTSPISFL
jgi:hypothetical protein